MATVSGLFSTNGICIKIIHSKGEDMEKIPAFKRLMNRLKRFAAPQL